LDHDDIQDDNNQHNLPKRIILNLNIFVLFFFFTWNGPCRPCVSIKVITVKLRKLICKYSSLWLLINVFGHQPPPSIADRIRAVCGPREISKDELAWNDESGIEPDWIPSGARHVP
jgi:hypothetical protein